MHIINRVIAFALYSLHNNMAQLSLELNTRINRGSKILTEIHIRKSAVYERFVFGVHLRVEWNGRTRKVRV